jgi:hypothetical protein
MESECQKPEGEAVADIRCIGIYTGGGDAPGLNAVIRATVKCAILKYKRKVIGIPDGFDGLIWPEKSYELTLDDVSGFLPRGGTILGTTNRGNPFKYCTFENSQEVMRDISDEVIGNARKLGIDAVVSIGGEGSQTIALEPFQRGGRLWACPRQSLRQAVHDHGGGGGRQTSTGVQRETAGRFGWQPDWKCHRHCRQQGGAGQRAGTHPARRFSHSLRSPFWPPALAWPQWTRSPKEGSAKWCVCAMSASKSWTVPKPSETEDG